MTRRQLRAPAVYPASGVPGRPAGGADADRAGVVSLDRRSRRRTTTAAAVALIVSAVVLLDNTSATYAAQWGVAAYLSAEDGLEPEGAAYWNLLLQAATRGSCDVAIQIDGGAAAARWSAAAGQMPVYEPLGRVDMASGAQLRRFLRWATGNLQAERTILIVLGHGSGVATLAPEHSGVAADAGSGGTLRVVDIARGVEAEAIPPFELISLEACYAASLETAWELRAAGKFLVASPDVVYSPGLPWAESVASLDEYHNGADLASALCERYSGPLVCLRLGALDAIGDALTQFVTLTAEDMQLHSPALRLERSRTRSWGYRDELCDIGQLAARLGSGAASAQSAAAARTLNGAILAAIEARSAPLKDGSIFDGSISGVGLFFPASWEPVPVHYTGTYGLAGRARWGQFLAKHYEVSGRDLIR